MIIIWRFLEFRVGGDMKYNLCSLENTSYKIKSLNQILNGWRNVVQIKDDKRVITGRENFRIYIQSMVNRYIPWLYIFGLFFFISCEKMKVEKVRQWSDSLLLTTLWNPENGFLISRLHSFPDFLFYKLISLL